MLVLVWPVATLYKRNIGVAMCQCCASIPTAAPTLTQRCVKVPCWLGRCRHQFCRAKPTQQTRHADPMLDQCWPAVYGVGPALVQHWVGVSCFMGGGSSCLLSTYAFYHDLLVCRAEFISRIQHLWRCCVHYNSTMTFHHGLSLIMVSSSLEINCIMTM